MVCPEMEFNGWVAIHTGLCRRGKTRFALIPDFLIPRRKVSRLGHERLSELYGLSRGDIFTAIDSLLEGLDDEYYLPRSTAMACIATQARAPPETEL
jgi:hypothetical protein